MLHPPQPPHPGMARGRRAPNWAQMAATDKDGGGMNTLINNYPNNDIRQHEARQEDTGRQRDGEGREKEADKWRRGGA